MRPLAALASCLAILCVPAASWANSVAPPGNSGVSQYFETVPSADGNHPVAKKPAKGAITSTAKRKLSGLGADGQAAAQLAEVTAPGAGASGGSAASPTASSKSSAPAKSASGSANGSTGGSAGTGSGDGASAAAPAGAAAAIDTGSTVKVAARTASSGSGATGLWLALGITLLAALMLFVVRRRRT